MINFLFAQDIANHAAVATDTLNNQIATNQHLSIFDFFLKGGSLMWVLLLLSVIAAYIFGERWWALRKAAKIDHNFMNNIKEYIHEGKIKAAMALCAANRNPIARMIEKGIERIGRPLSDVQTAVENVGNVEISKLRKGLAILASISGGAPMVGFLGTVVGLVQAFYNMSQAGETIQISILADGMYVAMITTVGGLVVGIPAYFGYNYLVTRIDSIIYKMESTTIEFMDLLNEPINQ